MRKLLLLMFFSSRLQVYGQDVDAVINAENQFAAYAKQFNTKDAFLSFSDSNAVVFNQGQALNVKSTFSVIKASSTKLLWQPAFAGVAISGELGFTTGPYEIRASMSDTILKSGVFSTIWHKNDYGEWKFLADMGIQDGKAPMNVPSIKKIVAGNKSTFQEETAILIKDLEFIKSYEANAQKAFLENLHKDACINIKGAILQQGIHAWTKIINRIPADLIMKPVKAGLSKSGDLAYVYGDVDYGGKRENYLRVWQNTAEGWRIVLQTLSW